MNEPTKEPVHDKPIKPGVSDNQRGFGVIELLFAASTICATIAALSVPNPKIPRTASD